ncbi:helix-turn-helix transcriptional regulator [Baekduia soli]|uniref:Helix-turn-helix transcriptional regulator n=1 Tax=Baekduia soli TaxID=496014 RepID=A0A5B8U4M9_9ACTN|nr:helix-turn-helix domain-containing protein [Baekduia soli]QEC48044.1 helix-turn-helix transcriptional regulator [Baekduia soli]
MPPSADQDAGAPSCCPHYHEAVELLGRRWTGAIVDVLLQGGPLRFGEIASAVPELSDRLLSQRLKALEDRGVLARCDDPGPPPCTRYALTDMGRGLAPAVAELKAWGRRWLDTSASTFRPE